MDGTERLHQDNIQKLKDEFGESGREEIMQMYGHQRRALEAKTNENIDRNIPNKVYNVVRKALSK